MSETANAVALGFDIGGTKLASIAVYQNGEIFERLTTPTTAHEGGKAVLSRLCQLAQDLKAKTPSRIVGIGVATHGVVRSETGIVRFASNKLPGWTGTNLRDSLSTVFPKTPIMVANDGHTATLAEYLFGSGQGSRDFVMLVLGTGVGGGVISNGELLQGVNGAAGRLGHLSIDPEGPQCSCGNRGCLELYVSGTAIGQAAMHDAELSADLSSSVGNELTAQDVVNAAKNGHPLAQNLLRDSGNKLGFAILQIARAFDPEIVAIGGGMISAGDLLLDPARTLVRAGTPPELSPPRIEWAQLGADASLLGAAMLGWNATRSGSTLLDFETALKESG